MHRKKGLWTQKKLRMCAGRHYSYLVLFPALAAAFLLLQVTDIPATPKSLAATLGEFAVKEAFHGKPAPALIRRAEEHQYRTVLREGAKEGPNFAGHFTIVQWGCGTNCTQAAVVDANTGKIYQLPSVSQRRFAYWLHFRLDSRLLIMCTNCRQWLIWNCDQHYFVWNGTAFEEIQREPRRDPHGH